MGKTILLTGATDGIGQKTAILLAKGGHNLLLHGRDRAKLERVRAEILQINSKLSVGLYVADFSDLQSVRDMATAILTDIKVLDVLINNAGIFVVNNNEVLTKDGYDIRFSVNTIAPYILTKRLLPLMDETGRVVNVSSAAQAPVDLASLIEKKPFSHDAGYAQSKLAIIMWGTEIANAYPAGPIVIAVNPKSFLGSKMVRQAYGRQGYDLNIGAEILCQAALADSFAKANGKYFDNDYGLFSTPHPYAENVLARKELVEFLNSLV